MSNVELKFKDTLLTHNGVPLGEAEGEKAIWTDANGAAVTGVTGFSNRSAYMVPNICATVQGQGANQRIGRKITIKSIRIALGTSMQMLKPRKCSWNMRVVLVWDKQFNGATPQFGDIFTNTRAGNLSALAANNAGVLAITSMPNIANVQRFKILVDKTYSYDFGENSIAATDDVSGTQQDKIVEIYKKLNMELDTSATTANINGIRSNNLILVTMYNCTNGDDDIEEGVEPNTSTITGGVYNFGIARIRYTDA